MDVILEIYELKRVENNKSKRHQAIIQGKHQEWMFLNGKKMKMISVLNVYGDVIGSNKSAQATTQHKHAPEAYMAHVFRFEKQIRDAYGYTKHFSNCEVKKKHFDQH